ncbi:unnamed protein product [Rotaria sp. Silwood1]|nr:unnamed protein product [Rotaria sp. Silwood1]
MAMSCTIILSIAMHSFAAPTKAHSSCGYDFCNLGHPNKLNVHIVTHTHDDVGWLKTIDQYYYGSRSEICNRGVQYIIDSMIQALLDNPDRRYIYVEMAFFWRWWNQQSDDMRNTVRQLVNEGRLEFISGGWSMHDEGATHYNSIIDQHSLGAEFLRDQFGDCARPKIGWQIDPFGHSREVASLFAQMGFDGLFFGRADYQDIAKRNITKTMEMIWKGSANLDRQSWLFTGILPHGYDAPESLCFDILCTDAPIMDDARLHDYNVPERVQTFINAAHNEQANGSDVNVFYSTPSCYLYALNQANKQWTSKTDDFFPYATHSHAFWTGYYTSRATLKGYERYSNNILQVTRQLNAFSQSNRHNTIFYLSEAMGIVQHHDAVSGTERQHVANDYVQRLSEGIDKVVYTPISDTTKMIPGRTSAAQNQYIFEAQLPALGYNTYYFEARSFPSNSTQGFEASGAYMFRPLSSHAQPVSTQRTINCTKTKILQSAFIVFNSWVTQQITLYPEASAVEIEWTLGPIPIDDNVGKEIVIRYDTNINSASKYYTDANGREVLERIRNYRPTWNYSSDEPISGNYYPINSRIWIRDNQTQLTILTDRSEGGGSMYDGSIEIMLHRRILYTDGVSLNEALNETAYGKGLVVRGKHYLFVEPPSNSARMHRISAQSLFLYPLATYSLPDTSSYINYSMIYRQTWSALADIMPLNVHLLTFDQLSPKEYLVRLEHYFELNEDDTYSQPVTIDLQDVFKTIGTIVHVQEMILTANLPLSDLHRLEWITNNGESSHLHMPRKFDII